MEEEQAKLARLKELRRARNQRHRQKLKERKGQVPPAYVPATQASARGNGSQGQGPVIVPLTPNSALTSALKSFNSRFCALEFEEDRGAYRARMEGEWHTACQVGNGAVWIEEREGWIRACDALLDDIENFLGSGMLESLALDVSTRLWASITAAVFKVQWMVAVLEAYLDVWTIPVVQ
ncbi:hypothetical protein C8Q70DRAFT_1059169 [Cubamyces menziesii]|nr:hypothetical protein C8Q70DRAFT_1059169 [Cubamyces menziesii]